MPRAVLCTDGGARGNPGPAGGGFVLVDEGGAEIVVGGRYFGETTNNVAEYRALIAGLEAAVTHGVGRLLVRADSELVVRQMRGEYKVKHPNLRPLFARAQELVRAIGDVRFEHVRRHQNEHADALANQAMDARSDVGVPDASDPGGTGAQETLWSEV